jgi:hypothetical protein
MDISVFKLLKLIQDDSSSFSAVHQLGNNSYLVTQAALADAILKSDAFLPYSLISYFKKSLPAKDKVDGLDLFFKFSPLLLSGIEHRYQRRDAMLAFKQFEDFFKSYLPHFTVDFFSDNYHPGVDPVYFSTQYTENLFKQFLANALLADIDQISLVDNFFSLRLNSSTLQNADRQIQKLLTIRNNNKIGDSKNIDLIHAITFVIMGKDALIATFSDHMIDPISRDSISLFRRVAPVNVIGRTCVDNVDISGHFFHPDNIVYIHPRFISQSSSIDKSYSFGMGKHTCPGRKISYIIADSFIEVMSKYPPPEIKRKDLKLYRDLVSVYKVATRSVYEN